MNNNLPLDLNQEEVTPASKGLRFINYLIDTIATYALAFLFIKILTVLGGALSQNATSGWLFILIWPATLLYYILMEHLWSKTLGKIVTDTKVVTEDGDKPTLRNIVTRNLARLIPINPFSFFMGETGWHDGMTGTTVIKA